MSKTNKQRREQGLCPYCGKEPLPNKTKCASCTEKYVTYKRNYVSKLNDNQCKTCGGERDDRFKTCSSCRSRIKLWRENHIANGGCNRCGQEPLKGLNTCLTCYLKTTSQTVFGTVNKHKELLELFEQQKGFCPYSSKQLTLGVDTSLDHKIPKSKGGSDDLKNLQWTHRLVNEMKWNYEEQEFYEIILAIADTYRSTGQNKT